MRYCVRCGFPFEPPTSDDTKTNVCGNCADDLRQEEDAESMAAEEEAGKEEQRWLGTGG